MTGIFGVYLSENEKMEDYINLRHACALNDIEDLGTFITMLGLFNLQHRGQLSAKVVSGEGKILEGKGLVVNILKDKDQVVSSKVCMGSVNNYFGDLEKKQYYYVGDKKISFVHDGHPIFQNILNNLEDKSLSKEIIKLINDSQEKGIVGKLNEALSKIKGSYSWIFSYDDKIIAIRQGASPLHMGVLTGGSYVFASESCAFRDMDVKRIDALEPGEVVVISKNQLTNMKLNKSTGGCAFELVYRARPDSHIFGTNIAEFRIKVGKALAKKEDIDADIIVPVPESGIFSATGYSHQSNIPLVFALIRDYNMGRFFFESDQIKRNALIKRKLKVVKELIKDKKIIVVDEAIVTGTTLKVVVGMLKESGAKEVHIRIPSPVHKSPCDKGILSPKKDLLFNRLIKENKEDNKYIEEIFKNYFQADSLKFLDKESFMEVLGSENICTECLNLH